MTVAAIIQARMTSTRLPGKVLLRAAGREMLAHQINRVRQAPSVDVICVATTSSPPDDPIVALAEREGVQVFRGSEDDVLDRFGRAASTVRADTVIRLTGDCPLTDPGLIEDAVTCFTTADPALDYLSNGLRPSWPLGVDIEICTIGALRVADAEATDAYDREHVTPFLYRHPERFHLANISCPEPASVHRWTLDEPADFDLIRRIIEALTPVEPQFGWRDVLALVEAHPEWADLNRHVRQRSGRGPD